MTYPYFTIEELVAYINQPNRDICLRILAENRSLFETVSGSSGKHQAWPGGYLDHIVEVMNIAMMQYILFAALRPLPFSMSDAMLVLFLHDLEKPWKYVQHNGSILIRPEFQEKQTQKVFRESKLLEYGIELTAAQRNALTYVEGEMPDYSPDRRVMNELAAFCHICDVASARIWHSQPTPDDDWANHTKNH